jgi:hypothetical protein
MRETYVIRDGKPVLKHLAVPLEQSGSKHCAVIGDIQPFVSPIDGAVISSRAVLRDHCKRHNVVPTAELAGLQPEPRKQNPTHDREMRKRAIADQVYRR